MANLTQDEYKLASNNLIKHDSFEIDKIDLTLKVLWEFLVLVQSDIFVAGKLKPLKWYDAFSYFKIATKTYTMIKKVVKIWKQ